MRSMSIVTIDAPTALANALRRAILSACPGTAVDTITFARHGNTTCFWDEIVAHRIGQLPLRAVGDARVCAGTMELRARNDTHDVRLVTAGELRGEHFVPLHPQTPIVYLSPQSQLNLVNTSLSAASLDSFCRR